MSNMMLESQPSNTNKTGTLKAIELLQNHGFNIDLDTVNTLLGHFESNNRRIIMVMSHTCNHDFLLGLLLFHSLSVPITMFTNFKNPMLKAMSKRLGMVTHNNKTSNTQSIIDKLKKTNSFALLIGLAKTQPNQTVHSGYFYISQALNVPIIVVGFDYLRRIGHVSLQSWKPTPNQFYLDFKREIEPHILNEIQQIWPMKPHLQVAFNISEYKYTPNSGETSTTKIVFIPNIQRLYCDVLMQYLSKNLAATTTPNLYMVMLTFAISIGLLIVALKILHHKQTTKNKQH